ncbi:leucine-rich repeat family protein [Hibiscus syriacus]|uniref:Leucine-rich repeat family protein n=1 Tax=Hibiscus syriacus TaxID=106335 RepID=A0A6A3AEM0_HIBSY|nr:leucine-rich repeat family protein [Hibiscus syriacus]
MLAVFDKSVAKSSDGLSVGEQSQLSKMASWLIILPPFILVQSPAILDPRVSWLTLVKNRTHFSPVPRLFAVLDEIFCVFQGHIDNVAVLKQQYGLNKTADEGIIVIEAYRTLRDRDLYPSDQVVRDIQGKFVFILCDSSSKSTFIASDADGSIPSFWGTDANGHMVLADNEEIVKKGCGKSSAPFPKGCFFTSSGGLRSFEHP